MASHKIHIEGVADFSSISKDVEQITAQISKAFGDKGAKVLDESSLNFLRNAAPTLINKVQAELKRLREEAVNLDKAIKASGDDQKKQEELTRKRLENVRKTVAAEKDLHSLVRGNNVINSGGRPTDNVIPIRRGSGESFGSVGGKQLSRSMHEVAGELPGVSPVMQIGSSAVGAGRTAMAAGLGAPAIAGLALLAGAATGAAVAISRMVSGFEVFKQGIPNLLAITGMEAKPFTDGRTVGEAGKLGFGQLEVLDIQKQMEQALGKAETPREDQNRLLNILTAARDTGMDPRQIVAGAEQLRQQGGTEVANRQLATVLDKAITSGMDKTQASSFLSATVNLLTELNQNGVSNNAHLLAVMTGLVANKNMSAEQAAKTISGMSNAVSNSTGENNSFFQAAAARAGLGGGSILGTQFAVKEGLRGVNMGDVRNQVGDTVHGRMGMQAMEEMGLGDSDFSRKFASSILGEIEGRFDTSSKSGRQAALGFTGQVFGAKSAEEATKILSVLEKMRSGTELSKSDKKILEDLGKDPEAAWRDNTLAKLDATARATAAIQAALEKAQFDLGRASSDIINRLTGALIQVDATIAKFLSSDTFASIKKGLGVLADVMTNTLGGSFEGLTKIPQAISNLVDRMLDNPMELGKALGKGFAEIVMNVWTAMLDGIGSLITMLMDILKNPGKLLTSGREMLEGLGEALTGAKKKATDFVSGFSGGVTEGQEEFNKTGQVTYTPDQAKTLGDLKAAGTGVYGVTPVGMAVRAGSELMSAVKSNGVQQSSGAAPTAAPAPTMVQPTDVSPVVQELKKTNALLERSARPGNAPRAGRESSRP